MRRCGEEMCHSDLSYVLGNQDIRRLSAGIRSSELLPGPLYLEIHVTDRCNSRCYFCNQDWVKAQAREFSLDTFRQVVGRLTDNGLRAVRFSGGGDPTVHPDILRMLQIIHRSGLVLARFDTNGIRLTPELSKRLLACGLEVLHISLQAPTPESWAKVTQRRPADFHTVIENIRAFKQLDKTQRTSVYATFALDEPTFDKLEQMILLCQDLDIDYTIHELNCYTYSDRFLLECLPKLKNQLERLLATESPERGRLAEMRNAFFRRPRGGAGKLRRPADQARKGKDNPGSETWANVAEQPCLAPWTSVLIRPSGNVYLCCALAAPIHILGNIFEQDILEIWKGPALERVRQEAKALFFPGLSLRAGDDAGGRYRYLVPRCGSDCPVKVGMLGGPRSMAAQMTRARAET